MVAPEQAIVRRLILSALVICFAMSAPRAPANPIGDFFKRLGHSIAKLGKSSPPPEASKKPGKNKMDKDSASKTASGERPAPASTATPWPTPTPLEIRPATPAPPETRRRDVPYGLAVPDKPGFVISPYAPNQGYVDVRAFPRSTEVVDPFTGKIFLTP